jgi:branched-chain amino acid transport system ATP-binding protein
MKKTCALRVHDLHAWYGEAHVLHGVTLEMHEGEVVSLLGRNGSGRSTTLRAVMGQMGRWSGGIEVHGTSTRGLPAHQIARLGISHCPEERGIFGALTTHENLTLLPRLGSGGLADDDIYEMFPNLKQRASSLGSRLSGGEQQMLAMARILRSGARVLLLDEITEGLAPVIVDRLIDVVIQLKQRGYTLLLVEQNLAFSAEIADRLYVMESGRVVQSLSRDELSSRRSDVLQHIGV